MVQGLCFLPFAVYVVSSLCCSYAEIPSPKDPALGRPSCETNVAVPAVQDLQGEIDKRMAAEAEIAVITGERDSSHAECADLKRQLDVMQTELNSCRHMMNDPQGKCKGPAGQFLGQGCEGQPSGMGGVPLGIDAIQQEAGNSAIHLQASWNGVVLWLC